MPHESPSKEKLHNVAMKLAEQSELLQQTHKHLRLTMESTESGWQGRAADAFFVEMSAEVLPALRRITQTITDGADLTQSISHLQNRETF